MSSTYTRRYILVPSDKINREVSTLEARKPMESKKSLRQEYHALGACFKPYNDLCILHTCDGREESTKPKGCFM